jgi:hypothetical protein
VDARAVGRCEATGKIYRIPLRTAEDFTRNDEDDAPTCEDLHTTLAHAA